MEEEVLLLQKTKTTAAAPNQIFLELSVGNSIWQKYLKGKYGSVILKNHLAYQVSIKQIDPSTYPLFLPLLPHRSIPVRGPNPWTLMWCHLRTLLMNVFHLWISKEHIPLVMLLCTISSPCDSPKGGKISPGEPTLVPLNWKLRLPPGHVGSLMPLKQQRRGLVAGWLLLIIKGK